MWLTLQLSWDIVYYSRCLYCTHTKCSGSFLIHLLTIPQYWQSSLTALEESNKLNHDITGQLSFKNQGGRSFKKQLKKHGLWVRRTLCILRILHYILSTTMCDNVLGTDVPKWTAQISFYTQHFKPNRLFQIWTTL